MAGWIKVHRDLRNHYIWDDKPFSKGQAWIDLIFSASHKDTKFLLGNQLIELEKGSFVTSEIKLMDRWGWSKSKVRAFLNILENDSMIVKKTDKKKTTINIVNYSVWQDTETTKEPQKDHEQTTKEPQKDTIKNVEECKRIKRIKRNKNICVFFENVWSIYPNKKGKDKISKDSFENLTKEGEERITTAVKNYIDEIKRNNTEIRFVKHGSTFFNGGYLDYLEENYTQVTKDIDESNRKVCDF